MIDFLTRGGFEAAKHKKHVNYFPGSQGKKR